MPEPTALIAAWARSPVAPLGGAFRSLHAHDIAAPVVRALLHRLALPAAAIDAIVVGNALGAGGNPARMVSLASALPERCAAFSIDTQCCSGLDAITLAVGLLHSGQASLVIAGGVEAWSRSPIRHHRPLHAQEPAIRYERPAFAPDPAQDPDLMVSAADYAAQQGLTRTQQDAYACQTHQRALAARAKLASETVAIAGLQHDPYARALSPERAARMPVAAQASAIHAPTGCELSSLAISAKADAAAFILLATPEACKRWGLRAQIEWITGASVGHTPQTPLLAAEAATRAVLQRAGVPAAHNLSVIELHDAFAVQGLGYCKSLHLDPLAINRCGGGLARGHPIGASGAIALVRVLADLQRDEVRGAMGLAAIAGAGGVGAAALVRRL